MLRPSAEPIAHSLDDWTRCRSYLRVILNRYESRQRARVKRPDFLRLMNALKGRRAFQVLGMMDQSRLGRSVDEVPCAVRRITEAGVRVYFYLTDREAKRETTVDRFQAHVTGPVHSRWCPRRSAKLPTPGRSGGSSPRRDVESQHAGKRR